MNQDRRAELEEKAIMGTLTLEEMQEVIAHLRQGRLSAGFASKASKTKKVRAKKEKEVAMETDLFADLKGDDDGE